MTETEKAVLASLAADNLVLRDRVTTLERDKANLQRLNSELRQNEQRLEAILGFRPNQVTLTDLEALVNLWKQPEAGKAVTPVFSDHG